MSRKSAAVSLNTHFFFSSPSLQALISALQLRLSKKEKQLRLLLSSKKRLILPPLSFSLSTTSLFVCLFACFSFFFCVVNFHTEKTSLLRKLVRGAALQTRKKKSGKKKKETAFLPC